MPCFGAVKIRQFFVPYNGKIADITHADTNKHTLNLATALSETRKIIAVYVGAERIAGTGNFYVYPNEGTLNLTISPYMTQWSKLCVIANGTQRLQYSFSAANDDFDLHCTGYVVEA